MEDEYFRKLRFPPNSKVSDIIDLCIGRLPKKYEWATIRLKLENTGEVYTVFDHNNKKTLSDRKKIIKEKYGACLVTWACSNIDYGEYYYDVMINSPEDERK